MPLDPHKVDQLRERYFSIVSEEFAARDLRKFCQRRLATWQLRVYGFLEKPNGWLAKFYHFAVFGLIVCIHIFCAGAEHLMPELLPVQFVCWLEVFLTIYLLAEFVLRLWAIGADAHFRGVRGRIAFLCRPICVIDMIVIAVSLVALFIEANDDDDDDGWQQPQTTTNNFTPETNGDGAKMLRIMPPAPANLLIDKLRFVQILRFLHVDRQMSAISLVKRMVERSRFELVSAYYITFMIFLTLAVSVFTTEELWEENKGNNEEHQPAMQQQQTKSTFNNYGDSFWLSMVTILTIGYGDIVPRAWLSKLAICVLSFLGLSMFSTASGLVGVGMSLMLNGEKQQRQQSKVRDLAARLIQCWIRFHLMSNRQRFLQIRIYRRFCAKLQRVEERIRKGRAMARFVAERKQQRKLVTKLLLLSPNAKQSSPMTERKMASLNALNGFLLLQQQQQQMEELSDEERILDDLYYNQRSRSHTNSMHSSKSEEAGGGVVPYEGMMGAQHYRQIVRLCHFLLFICLKKKFKRARSPYDMADAKTELCELENQRMQKFKELEIRLHSQLGTTKKSAGQEVHENRKRNGGNNIASSQKQNNKQDNNGAEGGGREGEGIIVQRMADCEQRMLEMERKLDFIGQLANAIHNGLQLQHSNIGCMHA